MAEVVGARVERRPDADSKQAAFLSCSGLLLFPFVPADQVFRDLQHLRIIPRVVNAAIGRGVGKFLGADVIAQPHFVRGDTQFVGADVHHALEEPEMLHARISAVGSNRTFVSDRLHEIDARVLEAVDAGKYLRPDDAAEGLVTGISAAVVYVARGDSRDHAVFGEGDASVAEGALIAVRAGGHVLGACFHPFNGPSTSFL